MQSQREIHSEAHHPSRTPLAGDHEKRGAKMVDFAGWWMPVQYQGLVSEHLCVRSKVGLFDVSHMGEIRVRGIESLATLEWLTSNHVAKLKAGQAQYSLLPNESGGLVDDIIVYCIKPNQDYLVCVNAANTEKDWNWFQKHNRGAELSNESKLWGQIAIQGPLAHELVEKTFGSSFAQMANYHFTEVKFAGSKIILATTGYTGEKGFEAFVPAELTLELWQRLLQVGSDLDVQPIGLGARDTLRTEMKYSLYGNEIDDETNPYGAGLGWVIKPKEKDFIGRDVILHGQERGLSHRLVGFKMQEKGIPRHGYSVVEADGKVIGRVTSGTHSPSLNEPIGIAYVPSDRVTVGSQFYIDIRGRKALAQVCKTPFVHGGAV